MSLLSTGLFISEALHPFNVFHKAEFEVDLVSETGRYRPDWLSQQKEWMPDEDRKVWEDHSTEFRSKLDNLRKPGDINAESACQPCICRKTKTNFSSMGCSLHLLAMHP